MIITIDSEIQNLLLDWYNLDDAGKDKLAHLLTDTGIKLKSNGKKGTTVIPNKIHHSYRSNEIRYLILKLITRGEERFSSIDIMDYFYHNESEFQFKTQSRMDVLFFSKFVADNFTDNDIEYFKKYCDSKYSFEKEYLTILEIPNNKIQEYASNKILDLISRNLSTKVSKRLQSNYHIDIIYKIMHKKCISVGKVVIALKKCTDKQDEYKKFMKFFPESEKYMSLI
jgi:hypothetical protein